MLSAPPDTPAMKVEGPAEPRAGSASVSSASNSQVEIALKPDSRFLPQPVTD